MGHCSTRTLNETRKCVEGIPDLPTNTPFFKCPFCERGKMVKKGGNKTTDKDNFIPGQAYHMDLAFVSRPSNLDVNGGSNSGGSPIVKKSRDGYIGFLTIIDVSSRKLWTHPIKNKDPPIEYIDKFLKHHGIRTTNPSKAIITTSGKVYLAKSRAFEGTIREQIMSFNQQMMITTSLVISYHIKWRLQSQRTEEESYRNHMNLRKYAIHMDMKSIQQQQIHHHRME
jgi:hypothetical protein